MKDLRLGKPEKMLFALLRASLHKREVETAYFQQSTEQDWIQCFQLAVRQGVCALAWEAVELMPEDCTPPLNVKFSWALREQQQLKEYRKQCLAAKEITNLLTQHGIRTIILKGVGLSTLYSVPTHRECGDIDIYTCSADKNVLSDEQANRLADEILFKQMSIQGESTSRKHSVFSFKDTICENHNIFLHIKGSNTVYKANDWLKNNITTEKVELLYGNCKIEIPTLSFNSVFISIHAAHHYAEGLCLKHLYDWAVILQQKGFSISPTLLEDKYFKRAITALTQLCNQYLGLSITVTGEEKLTNEIMQEILYPAIYKIDPFKVKTRIHIYKLKNSLLGVSFWKKLRGLICPLTL